jgi:chemotaxis protein methyltransferase CheR
MDIIFCRNVLMYFTTEWITKISQNLFHSLSEDGWFVVSSSELSSQVFPQFTPVNFPGAILYRKGKNGSVYSSPSIEIQKEEFQPLNHSTLSPLLPISLSAIQPSSSDFVGRSPLRRTQSEASAKEEPQSTPEESSITKIFSIRLLADQGHLEEALSLCNEAIASYKLAPVLYFLRASILQELDKSSEAIVSLKQAIYIDPEYIMGHFTLGNLFIRQGNAKNAKRNFDNVLDLISKRADDDILPESEGLSVKFIRENILSHIQTQFTK